MIPHTIISVILFSLMCFLAPRVVEGSSWVSDIFAGITKGVLDKVTEPDEEPVKPSVSKACPGTDATNPEIGNPDKINDLITILEGNINASFEECEAVFASIEQAIYTDEPCDNINIADAPPDEYRVNLGLLNPYIEISNSTTTSPSNFISIVKSTNGIKNIKAVYNKKYTIFNLDTVMYDGQPFEQMDNHAIYIPRGPHDYYGDTICLRLLDFENNDFENNWLPRKAWFPSIDGLEDKQRCDTDTDTSVEKKIVAEKCPDKEKYVSDFSIFFNDKKYLCVLSALITACGGKAGEFD